MFRNPVLKNLTLQLARRWNSTSTITGYEVSEFQIPYGNGNWIAGKLWKGVADPTETKRIAPIICLHGWLDNAGSFDPLLPLIIKPNMTAVAIDFPGHGRSSHFTSGTHYDPVDSSLSIQRVIRHFAFDKVILLGHSMGSAASYVYAGCFPEYVDGYIALDNVRPLSNDPIKTVQNLTREVFNVEAKLATRLPPPSYTLEEAIERSYLAREKTISRDGCKTLLKRGCIQRPDGKYSFSHDLRVTVITAKGKYPTAESDLIGSAIKCKVCIIKGDPGVDYEPKEDFLKVVDNLRRSCPEKVEFHLVPGNHHFHLNSPELVAPIINNFLWS